MDAMQELIAFLIILSGVLLLISRLKQQTVFQIFMVLYGLFGVVILVIPSTIATTLLLKVNGELGDLHIFLYRVLGVCCLSLTVTIYLNHRSPDAYTRVSLFFAILLLRLLVFFIHCLTPDTIEKTKDSTGVTIENKSLWKFQILGCVAVSALSIFMAKDFFGHSQLHSRLNMHMKVDFVLNLVFGILLFSYPKLLLGHLAKTQSFDEVLIIITQTYGAFCVASGTLSLLYTSVLFPVNKRHLMMSKVLETLGMIILILATNFTNHALGGCVQGTLLMYGLISFNALLGYYSPHETDSYVSKDE